MAEFTKSLLTDALTTVTGSWVLLGNANSGIQATVAGTGAVSATVVIEASNNGVNALSTPAGTITLAGTTAVSDGFVMAPSWRYVRARVTAIAGTSATINAVMGA